MGAEKGSRRERVPGGIETETGALAMGEAEAEVVPAVLEEAARSGEEGPVAPEEEAVVE